MAIEINGRDSASIMREFAAVESRSDALVESAQTMRRAADVLSSLSTAIEERARGMKEAVSFVDDNLDAGMALDEVDAAVRKVFDCASAGIDPYQETIPDLNREFAFVNDVLSGIRDHARACYDIISRAEG